MARFHSKFERKYESAIAALLKTTSVSQAAKVAGVGERIYDAGCNSRSSRRSIAGHAGN